MKKNLIRLSAVIGVATMLTGCVMPPPFQPKALNENAKGISTVRSTPYGCKVLGEAEGKDNYDDGFLVAFLGELRESALNDLRNNAADVVGNNTKRITLRIVEEKCSRRGTPCEDINSERQVATNYRVTAQIFECGNKE